MEVTPVRPLLITGGVNEPPRAEAVTEMILDKVVDEDQGKTGGVAYSHYCMCMQ